MPKHRSTTLAGHAGDLGRAVSGGRRQLMMQFANQDTSEMKNCFQDPEDRNAYLRSRLDPAEQTRHPEVVRLHTDLLALRRDDVTLREAGCVDGAVLADSCFILRYLTPTHEDRLIVVNLGPGLDIPHLPEPLAAPPLGHTWKLHWSSESPTYGGCGSSAPAASVRGRLPASAHKFWSPFRQQVSSNRRPQKPGSRNEISACT